MYKQIPFRFGLVSDSETESESESEEERNKDSQPESNRIVKRILSIDFRTLWKRNQQKIERTF